MNGSYGDVRLRYGMRWEAVRRGVAPLRTAFWSWSLLVGLALCACTGWAIAHGCGDWRVFVAAGSAAGTPALLHPGDAWRTFVYLPGAAWAFAPLAHLPLGATFVLDAFAMVLCAAVAGAVAARTYGLGLRSACAAFALWPPVLYSAAIIGQNAPFGLLLAQIAIAGFATRSVLLTAAPIGVLLYKPTYALPFVALLVLRGRRRELAIVLGFAAAWYVTSTAAAAGDWAWPLASMQAIARYASGDLAVNGAFAVGLPGALVFAGLAAPLVWALTGLLACGCVIAARRVSDVEAASATALAGLALNPHAWAYDAALAAPMIAYVASRVAEPLRTRALVVVAAVAPLFVFSAQLRFDPLAIVVSGGTLAWVALRLRDPA